MLFLMLKKVADRLRFDRIIARLLSAFFTSQG